MKTLYVFCEGPTEQGFCQQVLATHLYGRGFAHVPTIRVAYSKHRGIVARGGVRKYEPLRRDILNTLRSRKDPGVWFTTMLDLYGLPRDFPGKSRHSRNPGNPRPYAVALEAEFAADIGDRRFVPHLQLHEYETLLFADPTAFAVAFENCGRVIEALTRIAASVPSIEHIDDGENTAPSKRIVQVLPAYEGRKPTVGPDIAERIGMERLRAMCPHFHTGIER